MKIPYILTEKSVAVVIDGRALTMESNNPSWNKVIEALNNEEYEKLPQLFDLCKAIIHLGIKLLKL